MTRRSARPCLLLAVAAALLGGCGFGSGEERSGAAELRVTRDFGRSELASERLGKVREDETVMRFLRSKREVGTRYGGRFVQSIDGLSASGGGSRRDWFYFVNGIESDVGAAEYELSPGDVVQWDSRRWGAAMRVPAIVGAFPQPFKSGYAGKRLPVRLECEREEGAACAEVSRRLKSTGAVVSRSAVGSGSGARLLRVLVAPWAGARKVRTAATLERGPRDSGVFARPRASGRLELLDENGRTTRVEGAGTGLVAATGSFERGLLWLVTGTDDSGVEAAARSLSAERLRNAFAVAVTPRGTVRLPVAGGS